MAPRYKEQERDRARGETRQRLLTAAADAFARDGFVKANINHISAAAGFAKGTVYNYFESKQALMQALISQVAGAHCKAVTRAVLDETDPARRLLRFFEAGFAFVSDNPAGARVMIANLYGPDDTLRNDLYHAYRPMFDLVENDILATGIAQQTFRPVDPRSTATLLMTIYLGTGSQLDQDGKPWLDPAQVADFALQSLWRRDQQVTLERIL